MEGKKKKKIGKIILELIMLSLKILGFLGELALPSNEAPDYFKWKK